MKNEDIAGGQAGRQAGVTTRSIILWQEVWDFLVVGCSVALLLVLCRTRGSWVSRSTRRSAAQCQPSGRGGKKGAGHNGRREYARQPKATGA